MKASRIIVLSALLLAVIVLLSCSVYKVKGDEVAYPDWWKKQEAKGFICGYGMGIKVSQSLSIDAAKANAMAELASYVETMVDGRIKNYEEEAGVYTPQDLALTQKVVDACFSQDLKGIQTGEMTTYRGQKYGGPRYTTYVQMIMPEDQVDSALYNEIHNEEALYNQFKASQAFQELEHKLKNRQ